MNYLRTTGLWMACAVVLCGCAQKKEQAMVDKSQETMVYQDLNPADLMATLEKRYDILKNFSAQPIQATVASRLSPFGNQSLSGSLAVEKPNKVRLMLAKHHSPVRVDAICDGKNFWIVNHQQKEIYTGLVNEPLNTRGQGIVFNPVDIFSALFCTELSREPGFEYRITYVEVPNPGYYVVVVLNGDYPNKLYSKIWINRTTLQMERHQLFKPDVGEIKVDAAFTDFAENTTCEVPHKMVITWPDSNTSVQLEMKGLKINRTFDNLDIFRYDYADKGYKQVAITGKPRPEAGRPEAGLQERDATPARPPAVPPIAPRKAYPPGMPQREIGRPRTRP